MDERCQSVDRIILHVNCRMLKSFLASPAHFYSLAPFGVDDLVGADTTAGIRVENGVDDVATPGLQGKKKTSC